MIERLFIFAKAQVSSFVGGMVDYLVMICLTEFFHIHYTISIAAGGIIGAIVNFTINRTWTFYSSDRRYQVSRKGQLLRFVLVVANSIIMKSSGTYFFTTFFRIDYKISRIITDLTVSWAFNYMLQRHWVFRKARSSALASDLERP